MAAFSPAYVAKRFLTANLQNVLSTFSELIEDIIFVDVFTEVHQCSMMVLGPSMLNKGGANMIPSDTTDMALKNTRSTTTLFDLPLYDVLFPRIFRYFDAWEIWRIRTVSVRFNRICRKYFESSLAVLSVDFSTFEMGKDATELISAKLAAAQEIIRNSTQLKVFTLHLSPTVTHLLARDDVETLLTVVAHAAPKLTHMSMINLESLPFSLSTAAELGLCCSQLTELVLCNIDPPGVEFDAIFLNILDHPLNTLIKLTLSTIRFSMKETLCKSAVKTPNLRILTVG